MNTYGMALEVEVLASVSIERTNGLGSVLRVGGGHGKGGHGG
jgi:hypothetical protein